MCFFTMEGEFSVILYQMIKKHVQYMKQKTIGRDKHAIGVG